MRPKKPCPKCQVNKAAGMRYCNRCGAELAELKNREMIAVMLSPEAYEPEAMAEPVEVKPNAAEAEADPAAAKPQLVIMAADREDDGRDAPTEAEIPTFEVDPPVQDAASAPPADPADSADQDPGSGFEPDADTLEVEMKPAKERGWKTYLVIVLAVIACLALIAIMFQALVGPLNDAMDKIRPAKNKTVAPAEPAQDKVVTPTADKSPADSAKTDDGQADQDGAGLGFQPEVVTRSKAGTVQVDLTGCGPDSISVEGNRVRFKDCAKAVEPSEAEPPLPLPPPSSATLPADRTEQERVRRQADSLRILREVRKGKKTVPGPGLTGPTAWPADEADLPDWSPARSDF